MIKRIEVAKDLWRMLRVLLRDGGYMKHDSKIRETANLFEDELYNPPKSKGDPKNSVQQTQPAIACSLYSEYLSEKTKNKRSVKC